MSKNKDMKYIVLSLSTTNNFSKNNNKNALKAVCF